MDYQQAWNYLDSLQFFKIKLGLESMDRFLGRLGEPQRRLAFIHVAGTNGKGSVAATLLRVLSLAGYRVGLYTSPHLSCVRERFRIDERCISQEEFARHGDEIHRVLNGEQITYFEFTTALAMLWFAASEVDVAIMEVGLGGRLDATNIITPLVGVVTNVSMDHQAYLGETLAEVAWEKAGIVKPGIPLVSGVADDASRSVVVERCRELGAPLYLLGRDFSWQDAAAPKHGKVSDHRGAPKAEISPAYRQKVFLQKKWNYRGIRGELEGVQTSLRGDFQRDNTSVALAALELLQERLPHQEDQIRTGLDTVSWPGRLELLEPGRINEEGAYRLQRGPSDHIQMCSSFKSRVLLDGAHNPAGVAALTGVLAGTEFSRGRLVVVWASMADKDVAAGLNMVAPLCDTLILTRPESERSATSEAMRLVLSPSLKARVVDADDPAMAVELARQECGPDDLIVVAGSLYLVGAVRRLLLGDICP